MLKNLKRVQITAITWLIFTVACFAKYYYEFVINGPWGRNRIAFIPSSVLKFDDNINFPTTWTHSYGVHLQQTFNIGIYTLLLVFCLYSTTNLKFSKQTLTLFLFIITIFSTLDIFKVTQLAKLYAYSDDIIPILYSTYIWQTIIILGAIVSTLLVYKKSNQTI